MNRLAVGCLVAVLLMPACGRGSADDPALGLAWSTPGDRGFGEVAPKEIFNGGDPTGRFSQVVWRGWGGATAVGTGTGWWVDDVADGEYAPVRLVAFDLTSCKGRRVYRHLAAYFPTKGEAFDKTKNAETQYDLCDAP